MESFDNNKFPHEVYIIVNKCENLPDFRSEKEKQKDIKRKWQVVFHDTEENLATPLVEGVSEVTWMCETFLKLKSQYRPLSMSVMDEKSQLAGKIVLDMTNIPIGDKNLLKQGRKNEGSREVYRNFEKMQTMPLTSTANIETVLSFWIWILSFKEKTEEKGILNLERLRGVATNLIKFPSAENLNMKKNPFSKQNLNPFETESDFSDAEGPLGNKKDHRLKLPNIVGKSSFANMEPLKFRPSLWIPRYSTVVNKNPFSNLPRRSSLPLLEALPQDDGKFGAQEYKKELIRQNLSFTVAPEELSDFELLGQHYKTMLNKNNTSQSLETQEFFGLLNDIQRKYAGQILKIKNLEMEKDMLTEENNDIREKFYKLKTKLINEKLFHILEM